MVKIRKTTVPLNYVFVPDQPRDWYFSSFLCQNKSAIKLPPASNIMTLSLKLSSEFALHEPHCDIETTSTYCFYVFLMYDNVSSLGAHSSQKTPFSARVKEMKGVA